MRPASAHSVQNRLQPLWNPEHKISRDSKQFNITNCQLILCNCAFREISKPLVPQGLAGIMLVKILMVLCKEMVCVIYSFHIRCELINSSVDMLDPSDCVCVLVPSDL